MSTPAVRSPGLPHRSGGGLLPVLLLALAAGAISPLLPLEAREISRSDALEAIRQVWPDEHEDSAIRLAHLESGLKPMARGCGGDCLGLFQIHYRANRALLASMGIRRPEELLDPLVNSSVAYAIFRQSGWTPWGVQP